jgi:hypothetical protein
MRRILILVLIAALAPGLAHGASLAIEAPPPVAEQRSNFLYAPEFDRSEPGLSYFKLENNWSETSPENYLTFGEAFPSGLVHAEDKIAARYGDVVLPAQLDVLALHEDGSVRHAAVTVATPELKAGASIGGALIFAPGKTETGFDEHAIADAHYAFPLSLTFYYADDTTTVLRPGSTDLW